MRLQNASSHSLIKEYTQSACIVLLESLPEVAQDIWSDTEFELLMISIGSYIYNIFRKKERISAPFCRQRRESLCL